mmetsp:Transcript_24906/g.52386  ORF Transcript_24906/g.52386 Transcript_24906/m.52386 type:complete len:244 (+) Transcript_24906:530-1261(+)|eukprot:CAMPEP_0171331852 /NCGR_PEP_ID=MMETSP0878-20121228/2981_1 /TAXON_ID=67004 /ORGANISM="Thalassiosira weissflogii, Strain CCMP1336" /LENGTH=243 /DNA_ID=CAMNT_0011832491 /DNA_START=465 /DNA_END=1196 /DNA_ORIENTATION=-
MMTRKVVQSLLLVTYISVANAFSMSSHESTRREWLSIATSSTIATLAPTMINSFATPDVAFASEEQSSYDNPNLPPGPEERSGLVVLRVAEVAQFQEKILRAVLNGDIPDVTITPQQIVFGTQILLRNSNIAGNMKLMIETEIPRSKQKDAAIKAANTMNALQAVSSRAAKVEEEFGPIDLEELADLYRLVRVQLNGLYELLPQKEKDKYYGYFVAVTEYEKKIAEGVYNPDLDGVLKFDYDN